MRLSCPSPDGNNRQRVPEKLCADASMLSRVLRRCSTTRRLSGLIARLLDGAGRLPSVSMYVGRASSRSCSHLVPRRHDLVARSLSSLQKRVQAASSDRRCRCCSGTCCVFADARLKPAPLQRAESGHQHRVLAEDYAPPLVIYLENATTSDRRTIVVSKCFTRGIS